MVTSIIPYILILFISYSIKHHNHFIYEMAEQTQTQEKAKSYTYQDLVKFSNLEVYSGFGQVQ